MSAIDHLLPQPAGPSRTGLRRTEDSLGWRQVFDREQTAALAAFRSVKAPPALPAPPSGFEAPGSADSSPVRPALAGPAATAGKAAVAFPVDGLRQAPQPAGVPGMPAMPGLPPSLPRPVQMTLAAYVPRSAPSSEVDLAAGTNPVPLAAPTDKWPWRKLHCTVADDGVHLWLRDAGTTPHDPALRRWLNELQYTLSAAGMRLAGFTLNGKACLVPSLPSQRS